MNRSGLNFELIDVELRGLRMRCARPPLGKPFNSIDLMAAITKTMSAARSTR
jgi:hypothetical protein